MHFERRPIKKKGPACRRTAASFLWKSIDIFRCISQVTLKNLTEGAVYSVRVKGAAVSMYNRQKNLYGQWSLPRRIKLDRNCDQVRGPARA